jgi:hypothetical protein
MKVLNPSYKIYMASIIVQGVSLIACLVLIMLNSIGLIIGHLYENEDNKNYFYINYILLGLGKLNKYIV